MTGSALQLEAPFGLSLLVSGRYYGIGNDVLGVWCVSVLVAAAWLGCVLPRPERLALGGPDRGQRGCPVRGVRRGQLLCPGGGGVGHRDVRREPAARPGWGSPRAQGRLERGNAHRERGPMADPGRGGGGLGRALAAVVAPAADAAAGLRGRAGAANRRLAVLAGAYPRLARGRLRGHRACRGAPVRGAAGGRHGRLSFRGDPG